MSCEFILALGSLYIHYKLFTTDISQGKKNIIINLSWTFFGLNVFIELSMHSALNSITVNKEGLPKKNKKWKLFQDTTLLSELSSFLAETLIPIDLSHSVLVAITILMTPTHPFCFVSSVYGSQFLTSFGSSYITVFRLNLHV